MTEKTREKYTADEWEHLCERFGKSIFNDAELAKLGQNVGINWPFKGRGETPAKYIEYTFEELAQVPGLVGKKKRVHKLMDILRETLAFEEPFAEMVEGVESEGERDDLFKNALSRLRIAPDYPTAFVYLPPEPRKHVKEADLKTLIDLLHFGRNPPADVTVGEEFNNFLNYFSQRDEANISRCVPYRQIEGGLHLAEAIGLIAANLDERARLEVLYQSGARLTDEEEAERQRASKLEVEAALKEAVERVESVSEWFSEESKELKQSLSAGGEPERFFVPVNNPRVEQVAVQLARACFGSGEEGRRGILRKISGLFTR
ncbi:MAG: hypothetical protein ACLFUF_07960 [Opitutales bacterium]